MKSKIRIRRREPTTGTTQDGYGGGSNGSPSSGADLQQLFGPVMRPACTEICEYLDACRHKVNPNARRAIIIC